MLDILARLRENLHPAFTDPLQATFNGLDPDDDVEIRFTTLLLFIGMVLLAIPLSGLLLKWFGFTPIV